MAYHSTLTFNACRRIAAVLALVFAASTFLAAQSETVYVTKTGAKYHRAGCSSLRSSSIPMPLTQAAIRYGACKNCKPPIPATSAAVALAPAKGSTKAAPTERAAASGRCQATTKRGAQCSRNAKAGTNYCWQHCA
jgi:hypothetical protein